MKRNTGLKWMNDERKDSKTYQLSKFFMQVFCNQFYQSCTKFISNNNDTALDIANTSLRKSVKNGN